MMYELNRVESNPRRFYLNGTRVKEYIYRLYDNQAKYKESFQTGKTRKGYVYHSHYVKL